MSQITEPKSTPRRFRGRRRGIAPLHNIDIPLTPIGYDPSPILFHPSLRSTVGTAVTAVTETTTGIQKGKVQAWYEYITSTKDYEKAWVTLRDNMNEALFERMAVATPYLRDAIFYNLNATVLRQRPSSFHEFPLFHPSGLLRRLCAEVTPNVYAQISTSKPTAAGPWLMTNYKDRLSRVHNGVVKGKISPFFAPLGQILSSTFSFQKSKWKWKTSRA